MKIIFSKIKVKRIFIFISFMIISVVVIAKSLHSLIDEHDRTLRLEKMDRYIRSQSGSLTCKQPNLEVFAPEMMRFVHDESPIDCSASGPDWVKCQGNECAIQTKVNELYGPIKCSFTDILRVDDYNSVEGETTYSESYYKLQKSDVVKVWCRSSNRQWSATLTGIRRDEQIMASSTWRKLPQKATKLNVLMFGFDSVSRNSFIRKLPKSYYFLKNVLHADILEGYNIVGDGTPQALIPLLTGKTELELPDTRKRFGDTKFVNSYPFIWNDYKNAGYVTGFFEDMPELSTFTYRLNGFNETPTDHYMRPYYLLSYNEHNKWPRLCTGDIPRHVVMLNQIRNFFNVYRDKPKFVFGFHGEISHDDPNLIGVADDDLLNFLNDFHRTNSFENTLLVLMSDHGHRFNEIRNTLQGKQEERLPFFSFIFPKTFKAHFHKAHQNFQNNLGKLTSPFDIHRTLESILQLEDIGEADITQRAVSLFTNIPSERSCAHAYIEPHWCACLIWEKIDTESPIRQRIAHILVDAINKFTDPNREICEFLHISQIEWVMKATANVNLLKFNKAIDVDGFVPDFSGNTAIISDTYQVKVVLTPGDSIFEGSVTHFLKEDRFSIQVGDISRINMYGKQARCVEKHLPHLRKFCYCKD